MVFKLTPERWVRGKETKGEKRRVFQVYLPRKACAKVLGGKKHAFLQIQKKDQRREGIEWDEWCWGMWLFPTSSVSQPLSASFLLFSLRGQLIILTSEFGRGGWVLSYPRVSTDLLPLWGGACTPTAPCGWKCEAVWCLGKTHEPSVVIWVPNECPSLVISTAGTSLSICRPP